MSSKRPRPERTGLRRLLYENGLSLVVGVLFLASLVGHILSGRAVYNEEQRTHGGHEVGLARFLTTGEFGETLFENWESEFLQMGAFLLLTVKLRQRGSAESDKLDDEEGKAEDEDHPSRERTKDSPWPVKRGGWALALYQHSLGLAFFVLFAGSFFLHLWTGTDAVNEQRAQHGESALTVLQYFGDAQFWYQSFQNWQSEFLSVLAMVVLTIFLRERGSAESKHVAAPHRETGK
ncbi:MAG: DUF6766 family protein [Polyangiaceae bacterium]